MRIDSRSCTTVASGPLPKAGSIEPVLSSQGSSMAARVAVPQAAKTERPTQRAISGFAPHQPYQRTCDQSQGEADGQPHHQLAAQHFAHAYAHRKATDYHGFGLGTDRIRQVDDPWQKERQHYLVLQLGLETANEIRCQQRPEKSNQQPRDAMTETS